MNNPNLSGIALDSRQVKPGDVFIAVPGETQDGRDFIPAAIKQGAVAVITEGLPDHRKTQGTTQRDRGTVPIDGSTVPIIVYQNLKQTLGFIAARFYHDPSRTMPVIGITGTNGKTSCSHFIAQLLQQFNQSCGLIGTLGAGLFPELTPFNLTTPDPVALQAWLARLQAEKASCVAMEVTSHALMQGRAAGIQFHTSIFTNLTRDHLDYHKDFEAYFAAKQKLFTECPSKYALINLDDPYGHALIRLLAQEKMKSPTPGPNDRSNLGSKEIFGFTTSNSSKNPDLSDLSGLISVSHVEMDNQGFAAEIQSPWGVGQLRCPLLGHFNLSNVLAAVSAVCLQGYPFQEILTKVAHLKPVTGRMNHLGGKDNEPHVVIDYAHTPDALEKVLTALRPHCRGKLWCVFGCGGDRDPGKRPLMAEVAEQWSDCIIVTQDNPRTENPTKIVEEILKGFSASSQKNIQVTHDRAKAIQEAIHQAAPEDLIVIAGKGHETHQIIQTEKIPFLDETQARTALLTRKQNKAGEFS